MYAFISYANEQRSTAEAIALSLRSRGHKVFFDRDDLPAGSTYDQRIEAAIQRVDILIFLIAPESVTPGRYTLTELRFARRKWPNPNRRILPVMVVRTLLTDVPGYLKSVGILEPEGSPTAEVANAAEQLRGLDRAIAVGGIAALFGIVIAIIAGHMPLTNAKQSILPSIGREDFRFAVENGLVLAFFFAGLCWWLSSKKWWNVALTGTCALFAWILCGTMYIATIPPVNRILPEVRSQFKTIVESLSEERRSALTEPIDAVNRFLGTAGSSSSGLADILLAIVGGTVLYLPIMLSFAIAEPALRSTYRITIGLLVAALAATFGALLAKLNPLVAVDKYLLVENATFFSVLYMPWLTAIPALIGYWASRGQET